MPTTSPLPSPSATELELAPASLLEAARDEAYHLRAVTAELRNRSKTLTRVYDESLARLEHLIDRIESSRQEAQGYERRNGSTQARE